MIPYGRQLIDNNDINSVKKILKSNWLTTGPTVQKFEENLSKVINSKYVSVVNSATSALHLACLSLGLKKGDIVWTTPNTFVSTANSALLCGAKIDLVDIEMENYNLCPLALEQKLRRTNKKAMPKIVIPVHFGGHPCDMERIYKLSKKYKFKIIEDASHAVGSKYKMQKIGNCKYSDIAIFSLHPVKIITTGEGGILSTKYLNIYKKVNALRSHGIYRNKSKKNHEFKKPWLFYQKDLGLNYRLTDIQAALGISQLKKLNFFLTKRNKIAKIYNKAFKNLPLILPKVQNKIFSSYHLYPVLVKNNKEKIYRDKLYKILLKKGIITNIHYIPIYKHPYFKKFKFKNKNFPNNEYYFKRAISLPIHPFMKEKDINYVIKTIKSIYKNEK